MSLWTWISASDDIQTSPMVDRRTKSTMLTANLAITLMIGLRLSTASGSVGPSKAVVYHYGTTSMSWEHAASYCARRGWRLAQFNSDYDLSALKHRFSSIGIVWIGLASTESGSTTYRWTDCTPYGDHTRAPWAVNEPNSLDSQLCVMMKAFTFKTNDCSKPFKFLCEEIQEAGTCMFQTTNPAFFASGTERTDGAVMSAGINCQQACLEYQEVKQCVGYSYYDKTCELYLGQFLIFPNSTSGAKPHVSVKVCHSYQTIDDKEMDSWDEPFPLACDEGLPEESMSNEFADGITEAAYSEITDGLTSSSLSSSSVTMVTTIAIPPTSYHLQSSNMLDTGLDSTVTQTAALPSPTIQEVTNEPSRGVASTDGIKAIFPLSGHMQTSTVPTRPTGGSLSKESYSSDALLMSPTILTGTVYGTTTDSTEVPQSASSYSTNMLQVSSTTWAGPVYGTTTDSTEVPQSSSYSTNMLQVSSTTLADPVHATTSRMVSTTCVCPCGTLENRTASHSKLIKELIVKKTTLSSFKRKKTSARDERPSAQAIGNIGIALLAFTGVLILILDADVIARLISGLFKPR